MLTRLPLLICAFFICTSSSVIHASKKLDAANFQKKEDSIELKALKFIYDTLNIKDLNTLDKCAKINDEYHALRTCYIQSCLDILSHRNHFDRISSEVLEQLLVEKSIDDSILLSLVLCIEASSKNHNIKLYESDEKYYEKDFADWFVSTPSFVSKVNENQAIFCWCSGGGSHNGSYFIWLISKGTCGFYAKQLNIPVYNVKFKSIDYQNSTLAQNISYNEQHKKLVLTISTGDVSGWSVEQLIFDPQQDSLKLSKQRVISNYTYYQSSTIDDDTHWDILYSTSDSE